MPQEWINNDKIKVVLLDIGEFIQSLHEIEIEHSIVLDEFAILRTMFLNMYYEDKALDEVVYTVISIGVDEEYASMTEWLKDGTDIPVVLLELYYEFSHAVHADLKHFELYENGILQATHYGNLGTQSAVLIKLLTPNTV